MQRFCVRCGKETGEIIRGLCAQCYLEKHPVLDVPRKIRVDYDYRSGRIRAGHNWLPKSFEALTGMVAEKIGKLAAQKRIHVSGLRVLLEPAGDNFAARAKFEALVEGVKLPVEKLVVLELAKAVSDASTKLASNYFEATIQVRFVDAPKPREMSDRVNEISALIDAERARNELSAIVAVKRQRRGVDLVVGSFKAADKVTRRVARRHGTRVVYSNSLFGVDDSGKNRYRHTYCLRFDNSREPRPGK